MADMSIQIKTSISDAFFYEEEDNDRFDEWLSDKLMQAGLFDWKLEDTPNNILGVTNLSAYVNEFDYNHELIVDIKVDDGVHSFDELADNDDLFNYVERKLSYKIIDELNEICNTISFPMNDGTFADFKFDDSEFFSMVMYSPSMGYFISPRIQDSQLQLYRDFEVVV